MTTVGNLIWLIFGGLWSAIAYITGGMALCLTIVGIPFGLQCFKLAALVLWPFGKKVVDKPGKGGCIMLLLNAIWLLCGGIWAAAIHLVFGILLSLTVIGIPFGRQHFKLIGVCMMPFGKEIIEN